MTYNPDSNPAAFDPTDPDAVDAWLNDPVVSALHEDLGRKFRTAVTALGAEQRFIKPHCPWTNGKVERFNRTLQTEWAYRRAYTSNTTRATALQPWLTEYNYHRPHTALRGQPPISRMSPTC